MSRRSAGVQNSIYYLFLDVAVEGCDILGSELDSVPGGLGYRIDVVNHSEGDGVVVPTVFRVGLVEGGPDEGRGLGEHLLGVVDANVLVESLAAGGVRNRVRRVESHGAGRGGQGQEEEEGSGRCNGSLHRVCVASELSLSASVSGSGGPNLYRMHQSTN